MNKKITKGTRTEVCETQPVEGTTQKLARSSTGKMIF